MNTSYCQCARTAAQAAANVSNYDPSRHTIVCRAAQESGVPHRGYIDRKKENIIFTPLYLGDPLSDWNQIYYRVAHQLGESTFQI